MSRKLILLTTVAALAAGSAFAQMSAPPGPSNIQQNNVTGVSPADSNAVPNPAGASLRAQREMPWSQNLTSRDLIGKKVFDAAGTPVADIKDVVTRVPNGAAEVVVTTPQNGQVKTVVLPLTKIYMEKDRLMTNAFGGASPHNLPSYSARDYQKYDPNRRFGS